MHRKQRPSGSKASSAWYRMMQMRSDDGLPVCDRWLSISSFLEDVGDPPSGRCYLARKDISEAFSPENFFWRATKLLSYRGKEFSAKEMAVYLKTSLSMVRRCLKKGFSGEEIARHVRKERSEKRRKRPTRAGKHQKTYNAWSHLFSASTNICKRWDVYENFLEDMGERPAGTSFLRRIDPELPWSAENCAWVPVRTIEYLGEELTLREFSNRSGLSITKVAWGYELGQSGEEIVEKNRQPGRRIYTRRALTASKE